MIVLRIAEQTLRFKTFSSTHQAAEFQTFRQASKQM